MPLMGLAAIPAIFLAAFRAWHSLLRAFTRAPVVFVFEATASTFFQDLHNAKRDAGRVTRIGAELANMIPEKVFQHVVDAKDLLAAMTAGGIVNLWHVFPYLTPVLLLGSS